MGRKPVRGPRRDERAENWRIRPDSNRHGLARNEYQNRIEEMSKRLIRSQIVRHKKADGA